MFGMERRRVEWERLQELARRSGGHLRVAASPDLNTFTVDLHDIPAPVGVTEDELRVAREHRLRLYLPPGFPEARPVLTFEKPLFHPNCFEDGTYCYGEQWYPAMHLDEILIGVVQDIQLLTPDAYNLESPASLKAERYYRDPERVRRLQQRLRPQVPFPPPIPSAGANPQRQRVRVLSQGVRAQRSPTPRVRVVRR